MNAYDSARGVEAQANALIYPLIAEMSDGRFVVTNKGPLAKWLQECVGDVLLMDGDAVRSVEIKAERKFTRNVFLETFSNKNLEDRVSHAERGTNPGWMFKLKSDVLLYYFLDEDLLLWIDMFHLKRWMFGCSSAPGAFNSGRFAERVQRTYQQLNDTHGLIVPIRTLYEELPRGALRWTRVKQRLLSLDGATV